MSNIRNQRIDDCLTIRDGHLFIEACDAAALGRRFGTPIYVLSEDQLRRNVRRFRRAFEERWPEGPVHVLPSVKANFTLALLRILASEGTGCDTFGAGELHAALRAGIPAASISVNGSSKSRSLIEQALHSGARITLDSRSEVDLVREVARALKIRAKVRFRVRPTYEGLNEPSDFYDDDTPIRIAAQHYKPGIPTEELLEDLDVWRGMVRSLVTLLADLSRAWGGWEPREIDLGGGFAAPRDPTGRTTRRGENRAALAPSAEAYAEAMTDTLRREMKRNGLHPERKILEIEPGRSVFADAGIHLASVRGLKSQTAPHPWSWVETDTTEMFLLDTIVERNRWTTVVADKADRSWTHTADVVGISCGFDVIVRQADLPDVALGDIIAFLDTGAYQDACSNNFNALPRPAVILVNGSGAEVVKRAESVDDVFRRDQIPTRLGAPPSEASS